MSRKRIGKDRCVLLTIRIPGEWYAALEKLASAQKPIREVVRAAIEQYLGVGEPEPKLGPAEWIPATLTEARRTGSRWARPAKKFKREKKGYCRHGLGYCAECGTGGG